MVCFGPLKAFRPKEGADSKRLVFRKDQSHSGIGIDIPCGQCVGCRLDRARVWTMRCMHEKRLYKCSSFVTLTYDNDHLPPFGDLSVRDYQLFLKRLRKHFSDVNVRYYMCGEYGDINKRPHYHFLFFNIDFADKRFIGQNGRGDKRYTSELLRELWPLGLNDIGDVTLQSCAYVARYVLKKVTGRGADEHYMVYDADGVCHVRPSEFTNMSNGIGRGWYEKYGSEVATHDNVIVDGRPQRPPRYYDELLGRIDPARLDVLKVRRSRALRKIEFSQRKLEASSRRRWVKEQVVLARLSRYKRGL